VHVDGNVNPIRDKETIDIELQLKDLETVEKRLEKVNRAAKTGNKEAQVEKAFLDRIREALLQAKSARTVAPQNNDEVELMADFQLITAKPVLYVCNVDEASAVNGNAYVDQVRELVKDEDAQVIVLSVGAEADITELESYEERQVFLEDMGLTEPGSAVLIRAAYKLLQLQTYFTAGVKEVRAWTINIGDTAPKAAGVIHTDFEKGFIRAEVIAYEDFSALGSEAKVKEAGKLRVEGKEYIVKDGDVMHFRFNV
jgi:GTP-binding protein YchF